MTVIEYCTEEVRRQGHDIGAIDGIQRVGWMLAAWTWAMSMSQAGSKPELSDVTVLGAMVEPNKNRQLRQCGVRVGSRSRACPDYREVPRLLNLLFAQRDELTPMQFYRGFEEVHPFVDGNGRTGKILLNWLNGTLLEPIFPPNDFWGKPIINP
jgi:Fic/DOC family protein